MRLTTISIIITGVICLMLPITMKSNAQTTTRYDALLWIDASANIDRTNTRESIAAIFDKCVDAGIRTIIVDAKPGSGLVIYKSKIAPRLLEWKGKSYDPEYDRLQVMIEEGHKRGLKIFTSFFVFSEGHGLFRMGPIYDTHPEWAAVLQTKDGLVPVNQIKDKIRGNTNPVNSEVQRYELALIEEVTRNYDIDGVMLDGCRFDSIYADFSEMTKSAFERYLQEKYQGQRRMGRIRNWPEDIFEYAPEPANIKPGPYFKDWLYFRSEVIYDFFAKARETVKSIKPKVLFVDYAGSWYPTYYEVGVNWASKKYIPKYDWVPEGYEKTGYAELLDFFSSGNYYFEVTKEEALAKANVAKTERGEAGMRTDTAWWYSVEGSADLVNEVIMNSTPVYGTLYIAQYQDKPRQFVRAMEMIKKKTKGLSLFDLSQLDGYDYWKYVKLVNSKTALSDEDINSIPETEDMSSVKPPPNTTEDFAIDNTDKNIEIKGDWKLSTSNTGFLGENYLAHEAGKGDNFVKWIPNILLSGKYRVSTSWSVADNRATNATYLIRHKNGDTLVTVNQQENGGKWMELGQFEFDKGSSGFVQLSDKADGYIVADAIRFTKIN